MAGTLKVTVLPARLVQLLGCAVISGGHKSTQSTADWLVVEPPPGPVTTTE